MMTEVVEAEAGTISGVPYWWRSAVLATNGTGAAPADAGTDGMTGQEDPDGWPAVRIVVCYDGVWYQHVARYFAWERGAPVSLAGLHDAIRWHAAAIFGGPARRAVIIQAHYVAGRAGPSAWDQVLADHGIMRHDVPITAGAKKEVGADVELALTCLQAASDTSPDLLVLLSGDADFAPLVARLTGRGVRVLVPPANFSYPGPDGIVTVTTSGWLARTATDTPALADLLDAALGEDYPPHLARPLPPARRVGRGPPPRHRHPLAARQRVRLPDRRRRRHDLVRLRQRDTPTRTPGAGNPGHLHR